GDFEVGEWFVYKKWKLLVTRDRCSAEITTAARSLLRSKGDYPIISKHELRELRANSPEQSSCLLK
ncbi:hypothetical protein HAX54_008724, partial [Datura stramonium]|nr:hypothetical protein [Datura stramonium]